MSHFFIYDIKKGKCCYRSLLVTLQSDPVKSIQKLIRRVIQRENENEFQAFYLFLREQRITATTQRSLLKYCHRKIMLRHDINRLVLPHICSKLLSLSVILLASLIAYLVVVKTMYDNFAICTLKNHNCVAILSHCIIL